MSLRVWHLCSNRWNSAITEYALSSARALQGAGHDSVFFPLEGSPAVGRGKSYLVTIPLRDFSLRALPFLADRARVERPDVVITYGGPETILALALKAVKGMKVVRFRGHEVQSFGPVYRAKHWLAHSGVDMLLAPSSLVAASLRRLGSTTPICSVVLGCDESRFRRVTPLFEGMTRRPELMVFGRFDPIKGHAKMIEIMVPMLRLWAGRPLPPCLHIVGEAANLRLTDLEAFVLKEKLKLGEDVKITAGRVADVPSLLSGAALGVVPSLGSEIICRVAEEFLLCGTPVAVSGAGSLEEVLFPGAGFCYRGLSAEATAGQLGTWVEISQRESEFDKSARAIAAHGLYSLPAMAKNLSAALSQLNI